MNFFVELKHSITLSNFKYDQKIIKMCNCYTSV